MREPLKVFLLFLGIYLATMGGHLYSPDEEILFRTTESICERFSLSIRPLQGFATKSGKQGGEYAQYGVGQPILAAPFYWLGEIIYNVFQPESAPLWAGDTVQYHDRTPRDVTVRLGVSLFNPVVTALLCAVLFAFVRYVTRDRAAAWMSTLLFGLGTYAWVHSKPFFTEPLAALCAFSAFFLLYIGLDKKSTGKILIAGGLYAFSLLVRLDSLFMLPGYFVLIFLHNMGKNPASFRQAVQRQFTPGEDDSHSENPVKRYLFFAPLIGSVLIILFLNKLRFGSFFSTGYEDQQEGFKFATPLLIGLHGFLMTPGKGLFFFSPPLILSLFILKKFVKERRNLAIGTLTLIGCFLLIQSKWQNWPGGWCWGPRHIYQIHVFLALPLGFLFLKRTPGKRRLFAGFLTIGILVQLYGCSQNFIDYYMEFFASPRTQPNNYNIWYQESSRFLDQDYTLYINDENGQPLNRVPLWTLISPIQNSIYYPRNTVWANYMALLKTGRHDFFWLKLASPPDPSARTAYE